MPESPLTRILVRLLTISIPNRYVLWFAIFVFVAVWLLMIALRLAGIPL